MIHRNPNPYSKWQTPSPKEHNPWEIYFLQHSPFEDVFPGGKSEFHSSFLMNKGKFAVDGQNPTRMKPSKSLCSLLSHRIHGNGIFTYIYHKIQPFI